MGRTRRCWPPVLWLVRQLVRHRGPAWPPILFRLMMPIRHPKLAKILRGSLAIAKCLLGVSKQFFARMWEHSDSSDCESQNARGAPIFDHFEDLRRIAAMLAGIQNELKILQGSLAIAKCLLGDSKQF